MSNSKGGSMRALEPDRERWLDEAGDRHTGETVDGQVDTSPEGVSRLSGLSVLEEISGTGRSAESPGIC
jgi:hypothetical protein